MCAFTLQPYKLETTKFWCMMCISVNMQQVVIVTLLMQQTHFKSGS